MQSREKFYLASDVVEELLKGGFTTLKTAQGLKKAVEEERLPEPSLLSPRGVRGWTEDDLEATRLAMRYMLSMKERERDRWRMPVQLMLRKRLEEVG